MNSEQTASEILAHLEAVYVRTHEYVGVRELDFPHLDLAFYRSARCELEAAGFIHLEDCEDRTLATAPGNLLMPVMIRVMLSRDGTIAAGIFHPRMKSRWWRLLVLLSKAGPAKSVEFETEFIDGTFVCTSNALGGALLELPKPIAAEYLPRRTSIATLLAHHQRRLAEKKARSPTAVARRFSSISEVRASQNRQNALKAAFRGELGISREELEKLAGLGA